MPKKKVVYNESGYLVTPKLVPMVKIFPTLEEAQQYGNELMDSNSGITEYKVKKVEVENS